jgi:hypothetical protein
LVPEGGGGLASERLQKGTLRVKRPKLDTSRLVTVLEGGLEDDHYLVDVYRDDKFVALMRRIYSCDA